MLYISQLGRKVKALFPWGSFIWDMARALRAYREELDELYAKMNADTGITGNDFGEDSSSPTPHERKILK